MLGVFVGFVAWWRGGGVGVGWLGGVYEGKGRWRGGGRIFNSLTRYVSVMRAIEGEVVRRVRGCRERDSLGR